MGTPALNDVQAATLSKAVADPVAKVLRPEGTDANQRPPSEGERRFIGRTYPWMWSPRGWGHIQALHKAETWHKEQGSLQSRARTLSAIFGFNFAWNFSPNTQNADCLKLFSLCSEFLLYDRSMFFLQFLKPSGVSWLMLI